VLTLSLRPREEETADARIDGTASFPSLSGVHPIKLPKPLPSWSPAKEPHSISPAEASLLSELVQRNVATAESLSGTPLDDSVMTKDFMPRELSDMHDAAFRIGREIWRLKTNGERPDESSDQPGWATPEEIETAKTIVAWEKRNRETEVTRGRHFNHAG
jgi:hypothetical protein